MEFTVHATLKSVRMSEEGWKIQFDVPESDSVEMAKISVACKREPLIVKIETENIEPIGQQA